MTVAFDAVSTTGGSSIGATPNPGTWTHTPTGTPAGVIVMMFSGVGGAADLITAVDYGGVPMHRIAYRGVSGENGESYCYYLGTGIPTGAQTVSVTHTGTADGKWGVAVTVTAARDTEVILQGAVASTSQANPSVTLDAGAKSALRFIGGFTGNDSPGSIAAAAGCTILGSRDSGTKGGVFARETTASTGSTAVGFTITADDVAMVAAAVAEIDSPALDVAFDASSLSGAFTTTPDPYTWTHVPVGTPRGVAVWIFQKSTSDLITSVSYGGDALTQIELATIASTESGGAQLWFLGSSVPTGSQTVSINHTATADAKAAVCWTFTGSGDLTVADSATVTGAAQADPSYTFDSSTTDAVRILGGYSGAVDEANIQPATADVSVVAAGENGGVEGWLFGRQLIATTGSGTIQFTMGADEVAFAAASIEAVPAAPDAPTNPTATADSQTQITVDWDNVANETGYRVERSLTGVGAWSDVSGNLAADTVTYADTGLTCNTQYFYRVFAFNGVGDSAASATVNATTDACTPGSGGSRMGGTGAIRKPPRRR